MFAVKTIDLGSYLKVFIGIKKKKITKKFFLAPRKFVFWHFGIFRKRFYKVILHTIGNNSVPPDRARSTYRPEVTQFSADMGI